MEIEVNDNRIRLHDFLMFQAQYDIKLKEKDKEINRLNNIINGMEKYLIEEIEDYEKRIKYHKKNKDLRSGILDLVGEYEGEKVCFEDMLGKLQELKGSDSNGR
jgi:predicted RNA-binding protein